MQGKSPQEEYFAFAYKTGSDFWSHTKYHEKTLKIIESLLDINAHILELGHGRGIFLLKLLEKNYKVFGVDIDADQTQALAANIINKGFKNRGKVLSGTALNCPFEDYSFDLVFSAALFQHIQASKHEKLANEIHRLLKPGQFYLQLSMSSSTQKFMGLRPLKDRIRNFEKFGVSYYLTNKKEIEDIFSEKFNILQQHEARFSAKSDPEDDIVFLYSLMQKK